MTVGNGTPVSTHPTPAPSQPIFIRGGDARFFIHPSQPSHPPFLCSLGQISKGNSPTPFL